MADTDQVDETNYIEILRGAVERLEMALSTYGADENVAAPLKSTIALYRALLGRADYALSSLPDSPRGYITVQENIAGLREAALHAQAHGMVD